MKRKSIICGLMVTLSFVFICNQAMAEDLTRFKGQKLTVTCWSGPYADSFKKAYVNPFMEASGANIIVSPGWSEFMSKIKASPEDAPYDVFMADGWNYIAAMNIGRLQPNQERKHSPCKGYLSRTIEPGTLAERLWRAIGRERLPAGLRKGKAGFHAHIVDGFVEGRPKTKNQPGCDILLWALCGGVHFGHEAGG